MRGGTVWRGRRRTRRRDAINREKRGKTILVCGAAFAAVLLFMVSIGGVLNATRTAALERRDRLIAQDDYGEEMGKSQGLRTMFSEMVESVRGSIE